MKTQYVKLLNFSNHILNKKLKFKELEAIKARVREMEEEAEKLKMLQSEVEKQINSPQGVSK